MNTTENSHDFKSSKQPDIKCSFCTTTESMQPWATRNVLLGIPHIPGGHSPLNMPIPSQTPASQELLCCRSTVMAPMGSQIS